jgi:hypothetical protein
LDINSADKFSGILTPHDVEFEVDRARQPSATVKPTYHLHTLMDETEPTSTAPRGSPSLYHTALNVCIRNVTSMSLASTRLILDITSVGSLPVKLVAPILGAIKVPSQLANIERNSPQLYGHTAKHWRRLFHANLSDSDERYEPPEDPRMWYAIYKVGVREWMI